jgi:hypothetical protein
MIEPFWQTKHDWWLEDFSFEIEQKKEFILLLRKHPDDDMGESFREIIKSCDCKIKKLQREYKKIYGVNFNLRRI